LETKIEAFLATLLLSLSVQVRGFNAWKSVEPKQVNSLWRKFGLKGTLFDSFQPNQTNQTLWLNSPPPSPQRAQRGRLPRAPNPCVDSHQPLQRQTKHPGKGTSKHLEQRQRHHTAWVFRCLGQRSRFCFLPDPSLKNLFFKKSYKLPCHSSICIDLCDSQKVFRIHVSKKIMFRFLSYPFRNWIPDSKILNPWGMSSSWTKTWPCTAFLGWETSAQKFLHKESSRFLIPLCEQHLVTASLRSSPQSSSCLCATAVKTSNFSDTNEPHSWQNSFTFHMPWV